MIADTFFLITTRRATGGFSFAPRVSWETRIPSAGSGGNVRVDESHYRRNAKKSEPIEAVASS